MFKKDKDDVLGIFTDAYYGQVIRSSTNLHGNQVVYNPRFSGLFLTQYDNFKKIVSNNDFRESGYISRCTCFIAPRITRKAIPKSRDNTAQHSNEHKDEYMYFYEQLVNFLYKKSRDFALEDSFNSDTETQPKIILLSKEACKIYNVFNGRITEIYNKLPDIDKV